jgi:hypothetical protein
MTPDWLESLDPDERAEWDRFVEHFRRDALEKISGSAAFVSIVPAGDFDVKFATELGAAVILGKPLLAIVTPDTEVSPKFRSVCDEIVVADVDTGLGREKIAAAIRRLSRRCASQPQAEES